jgi:hypothetical protein
MTISIRQAIRQLLTIVNKLCIAYPKKKFTLDGRLLGDIGEVLVEDAYDLTLFEGVQKHHDAVSSDGRLVQIKATMKKGLTFPADYKPKYFLGVQIHRDGSYTEVFNGPGKIAWKAVKGRSALKTNLHTVSIGALKELQAQVQPEDRIPLRRGKRSR